MQIVVKRCSQFLITLQKYKKISKMMLFKQKKI